MTRFVSAFIGCLAFYCVASLALSHVIYVWFPLPAINGVMMLEKRKASEHSYDTLFLGSSMTYRHINPEIFDTETGKNRSYNLGVPGMFPPRQIMVAESILQNNNQVRLAFVEIRGPDYIQSNYRSTAVVSQIDIFNCERVLSLVWRSKKAGWLVPSYYTLQYLRAYFYKYLGFNLFELVSEWDEGKEPLSGMLNGYLAIDVEMENSSDPGIIASLEERKSAVKFEVVVERRQANLKKYERFSANDLGANSYLDWLNRIQSDASARGILVVYVLPPRLSKRTLDIVYPLFMNLDPSRRIDMSDPSRFPEFYSERNTFDVAHMNKNGSEIFSRRLAEEYKKLRIKLDKQQK